MKYTPLVLSLGFLFGIAFISFFGSISISPILSIFLAVLILPIFFFVNSRKLFLVALFVLGIVLAQLRFNEYVQAPSVSFIDQIGQYTSVSGSVASPPNLGFKKQSFTLNAGSLNGEKTSPTLLRVSTLSRQKISYGDQLMVEGTLKKPEPFETDTDRIFRYDKFLAKDNIYYTLARAHIISTKSGPVSATAWLINIKNIFLSKIYENIKRPHAGLAAGMLLGEKSTLGEEETESFRKSGLMHIVVLSGYNVSLVIYVLLIFMKPLPRAPRLVLVVLGIIAFGVLAGGGATVFRACLMGGLIAVSQVFGEHYNVKRALYFAVLVMVWVNPMTLIFDISFQLSVLATFGLLELAPLFEKKFARLPAMLRSTLSATLAAQIMVNPLIVWAIGDISLVSILVNILVLFMVPIAMLLSFAVGVFGLIFGSAGIVSLLAEFALGYILKFSDFFADLPFAHTSLPPFHWVWMLLLYGCILGWVYYAQYLHIRSLDRLR